MKRIVIDGNDGLGKSTICDLLTRAQIGHISDRGLMTKATDDDTITRSDSDPNHYFLIDGPVELSQQRLVQAGRSLEEKYHNLTDLIHYRQRFLDVANRFDAKIIDASKPLFEKCLTIVNELWPTNKPSIAIPTGKLFDLANSYIKELGYELDDTRQFIQLKNNTRIFKTKPKAIPGLVYSNRIQIGFVGKDVLMENENYDSFEIIGTFAKCNLRLVLASYAKTLKKDYPNVIATEYPNFVSQYFLNKGIPVSILPSYGSTEGYCPYYADFIVDLVDTGRSLAENDLFELETLSDVEYVIFKKKDNNSPFVRLFNAYLN